MPGYLCDLCSHTGTQLLLCLRYLSVVLLHLILPIGIIQGAKRVNYSVPERVDGQLRDHQEVLPAQVTFSILVQAKKPVNIPTKSLPVMENLVCSVSICFRLKPVSSCKSHVRASQGW